ncbi:hypothetical protein IA57_04450 [Mangrovimonas yunxiaonensis]|uniref:Transposase n=1 Tax=Mangrovimonas yunxiaonensis TaxID=1197477 RepID=A0A084TK55_9FLAO|nr:hypothetical protein IA57_04450 [Mangrovimonas yunxiaonensis]
MILVENRERPIGLFFLKRKLGSTVLLKQVFSVMKGVLYPDNYSSWIAVKKLKIKEVVVVL